MKKTALCSLALTTALLLAACGGAPASGSAPASQPASEPASQPASTPASQPASASEPASEPASQAADYTAYTLQFDVPEGLAQLEELPDGVSAMFQAEDGSNLNLVIYDNDGSLASDLTQDAMVSTLEEGYSQQLGMEITLEDVAFVTGTLGDVCPYYRLDYTVVVGDVSMTQTLLGINADRAYTFTYTDMTGGWTQAFEDSIASIVPVAA